MARYNNCYYCVLGCIKSKKVQETPLKNGDKRMNFSIFPLCSLFLSVIIVHILVLLVIELNVSFVEACCSNYPLDEQKCYTELCARQLLRLKNPEINRGKV